MRRWLTATIVLASALAAGIVAFLNGGDPLPIHLAPNRTVALPLGTALAIAFGAGALLVGLLAAASAMARAFDAWRAAQRAARTAARLARTRARAETLLVAGDADAARSRLADAMTADGPDERLLELLAGASEQSGDLGGAIAIVEDARARRPESPLVARRLRDLYVAAGRWEDALALDAAVAPADAATTSAIRFEAACADDGPGGLRRLQSLAREHPGFVPAWVVAGDRLRASGRTFRARRTWERGARVRPAPVLLERLAALDLDEGKPQRTAPRLGRLRRHHPDDVPLLAALVRRHLRDDALDAAEAALATAPAAEHPVLDALRGECARRRGRLEEATTLLARATDALAAPDVGRCRACGQGHGAWVARCAGCGRWGTCGA